VVHVNKRSGPASKERILKEATKVFSEHGYEKSSMRMIAKASNISIGGLYLYFKNKEDLYLTLIKFMMDDYTDRLRKAFLEVQDPAGQMKTYITISLNYAKKHKELLLVKGRELGLSFGKDIKRKFFKRQKELVEGIIQKGVTSGVFSECNAKEATKIIRSTIRGFIVSMIIEEDALFSPEECSNLILNGLMRRERT
jgi:AcrR family transcriptional regulator